MRERIRYVDPNTRILRLEGVIDDEGCLSGVVRLLDRAMSEGARNLVTDLRGVPLISRAALHVLLAVRDVWTVRGGRIVGCAPRPWLSFLPYPTAFTLLSWHETLEEALRGFASDAPMVHAA